MERNPARDTFPASSHFFLLGVLDRLLLLVKTPLLALLPAGKGFFCKVKEETHMAIKNRKQALAQLVKAVDEWDQLYSHMGANEYENSSEAVDSRLNLRVTYSRLKAFPKTEKKAPAPVAPDTTTCSFTYSGALTPQKPTVSYIWHVVEPGTIRLGDSVFQITYRPGNSFGQYCVYENGAGVRTFDHLTEAKNHVVDLLNDRIAMGLA